LRLGVCHLPFVSYEMAIGYNGIAIEHYAAVLTVGGRVITYDEGVILHDDGVEIPHQAVMNVSGSVVVLGHGVITYDGLV